MKVEYDRYPLFMNSEKHSRYFKYLLLLTILGSVTSCTSESEEFIKKAQTEESRFEKNSSFLDDADQKKINAIKYANPAIDHYSKALSLNPSDKTKVIAYMGRAGLFQRLDEYNKAIKDYSSVLSLEPKNTVALKYRGLNFQRANEYEKAIKDYSRSIELHDEDTSTYVHRAEVNQKLRNHSNAIKDAEIALNKSPDNSYIYRIIGDSKFAMKDYSSAVASYDKAFLLESKSGGCPKSDSTCYSPLLVELITKSALAYEKDGKLEKAQKKYEQSVELNPGSEIAKNNLSDFSRRTKRK